VGDCCYGSGATLALPTDQATGSLTTSDATGGPRGDAYYFDDFEFAATAGTPVTIETTAADFDTYLYLLNQDCEIIAADDDSGPDALSRIVAALPVTGVYTVVVTSFGTRATGGYTLELNPPGGECEVGTCCLANPLSLWLPIDGYFGELSSASATDGPRGAGIYYDDLEFEAEGGTVVTVETVSAEFDTYLYLLDQSCEVIAYNDDGGAGLLSLMEVDLPETAVYTIVVTSYRVGQGGEYELELSSLGPGCEVGTCCYSDDTRVSLPASGPIIFAETLDGNDATDGPRGAGHYFDDFEFEVAAGTQLEVETVFAHFDTYLYLFDESCTQVASNDDGGEGTLSRIAVTLLTGGVYTVVVTSYTDLESGDYHVRFAQDI
jgi:hypothetical protein